MAQIKMVLMRQHYMSFAWMPPALDSIFPTQDLRKTLVFSRSTRYFLVFCVTEERTRIYLVLQNALRLA